MGFRLTGDPALYRSSIARGINRGAVGAVSRLVRGSGDALDSWEGSHPELTPASPLCCAATFPFGLALASDVRSPHIPSEPLTNAVPFAFWITLAEEFLAALRSRPRRVLWLLRGAEAESSENAERVSDRASLFVREGPVLLCGLTRPRERSARRCPARLPDRAGVPVPGR